MRLALVLIAASGLAFAQNAPAPVLKSRTEAAPTREEEPQSPIRAPWIVPAGTKIPVAFRQALSTKNAQPGDAIYAQTTFPIIVNGHVVIPAGTYVQGVVDSVKRAGRIKGTAEMAFHLTTLVYPNGYTVSLAAAVEQVPGDEHSRVKEPGTLKNDPEYGKDLDRVGRGATAGAAVGSMGGLAAGGGPRAVGVGGLTGIAAGTAIAMLARGSDLRIENGQVVDVVLNHAIALDSDRIRRNLAAY